MCDPTDILGGGGGGGGSTSGSTANNATTVSVTSNFNVDTTGVQNAINALAGTASSAQLAVAAALVQNAAAQRSAGDAIKQGLAAMGSGTMSTQVIVAIIGLVGVLIAAHVLTIPKIKV